MIGIEQLRSFVSRAPSAQALFDRDMRYLAYSDRWIADYGLDPAVDYHGRSHYDVFPEIGEAWKATHRACLAGHVERTEVEPFERADGRTQWLRYEVRPWYLSEDEIGGLVMLTEDLTDTVEAAQDRRQRDALYEAAQDAEAALWAFDADRRLTLNVGAPLDALGIGQGGDVGEDIAVVYADLPVVVDGVERVLAGERATWSVRLGSRTLESVVSPVRDEDGTVTGGVGISIDVTEREAARGQSQRQAENLRRLVEATAVEGSFETRAGAVLREITDRLGLDVGLLARCADGVYTCLASHAARGTTLAPGDELPLEDTYCALALEAGHVVSIDHMAESEHRGHRCYAAVGLESYIGVPVVVGGETYGALSFSSARPIRRPFTDDDRDLVRLVGLWAGALLERDLHERRLADSERVLRKTVDELADARDQAEAANRAKGAFLATMSHEIRTPMNAVIGFGQLLAMAPLDADQREYVRGIQRSGERLLGLIDDVLNFSKIEADRIELDPQPVALSDLVRQALEEQAPEAGRKGIELAYSVAADVPIRLLADEKRVLQVLANLVANAVKFTHEGSVDVALRRAPPPDGGGYSAVWVEIEVRDTGIGIAPDAVEEMFAPFVQGDASLRRAYEGAGLGLSITRRLVERMGGSIRVDSAVGQGSAFVVALPFEPVQGADRVVMSGASGALRGRRALLVGSGPGTSGALASRLRRWGVAVDEAGAPEAAANLLTGGRPYDLAVLDLDDATARAVVQAFRGASDGAVLPILVVSDGPPILGPGVTSVGRSASPDLLHAGLRRALRPRSGAEGQPATLRVLVAEDEPDNQAVALRMLGELGYSAEVAANGREALDRLRRNDYDLVLMDIMMPGLDGIEVTKAVREELPSDRQPRIVALTARALKGDRETCLEAGMDGYLSKPIRVDALLSVLEPPVRALA